jgi:hypothetical protein
MRSIWFPEQTATVSLGSTNGYIGVMPKQSVFNWRGTQILGYLHKSLQNLVYWFHHPSVCPQEIAKQLVNKLSFNLIQDILLNCGPGSSVGIATGYGEGGPGIKSRWGEIFRTCPDRPWGPPNLLYNGYRIFLGGRKRPGCNADPSTLLVPKSKNRVRLYLRSPHKPSWPVKTVKPTYFTEIYHHNPFFIKIGHTVHTHTQRHTYSHAKAQTNAEQLQETRVTTVHDTVTGLTGDKWLLPYPFF